MAQPHAPTETWEGEALQGAGSSAPVQDVLAQRGQRGDLHADQGAPLGAVVAAVQVAALRADAGQQVAHEHLQLLRKLQRALRMVALRIVSAHGNLDCVMRAVRALGRRLLKALVRGSWQPGSTLRRCAGRRGSTSQQQLPRGFSSMVRAMHACQWSCMGAMQIR